LHDLLTLFESVVILWKWLCSTGWLSHWGEVMANTSAKFMLQTLDDILSYGNGTGSVNFYMAHGGSNFGYWAGVPNESPWLITDTLLTHLLHVLTLGGILVADLWIDAAALITQ